MNQNQVEVQAVQSATQNRPLVSALTLAYGASVTNAQLSFAVSMAFDCLPAIVNEDKTFTYAKYVDLLESASAFGISKKTIQNNMSLTRRLIDTHRPVLATFSADETGVAGFTDWIRDQIAKTTYTLKRDDLIAWCKGEMSEADKRRKAEEDNAKAKAALDEQERAKRDAAQQAASASAPAPTPVPLAEVVAKQEEEAEAEAEAEADQKKAALEQAARDAKAAEDERIRALALQAEREQLEQAQAQAEEARKQAESFVVRVGVTTDGKPDIVVALNPDPAFLEAVSKELARMAKAIRKQQSASMGEALKAA